MNPGESDPLHHHDRPRQFTLQGALVIHLLGEFSQAHVAFVEQLEPDHPADGNIATRNRHPRLIRNPFGTVIWRPPLSSW